MIRLIYKKLIQFINYILNKCNLDYDFYEIVFNLKKIRENFILHWRYKPKYESIFLNNTDTKSILFVIPGSENMKFLSRNDKGSRYFYEIFQTLSEKDSNIKIHFFFLSENKDWIKSLINLLKVKNVDYVFLQAERDPDLTSWTLDLMVTSARSFWHGTFIYLLYDSYFTLHMYQIKRLLRIDSGKKIVITLDQNIETLLPAKTTFKCIGPTFLPISKNSLNFYDSQLNFNIHTDERKVLLSFIGKIYPYRLNLLNTLETYNVPVAINPQIRKDGRSNSSYLDYLNALSNSVFTLNFSKSHVGNTYQLKSRILEAACFGCLIITDEKEKISQFLTEKEDFIFINNVEDVANILTDYYANKHYYTQMRLNAFKKARSVLYEGLWASLKL